MLRTIQQNAVLVLRHSEVAALFDGDYSQGQGSIVMSIPDEATVAERLAILDRIVQLKNAGTQGIGVPVS